MKDFVPYEGSSLQLGTVVLLCTGFYVNSERAFGVEL